MDLHFFDPNETAAIVERRLPHWSQSGVVCFITIRAHDSMPKEVVARWRADRLAWLRRHEINPRASDWRKQLATLDAATQAEFYTTFSRRWHEALDACHGACVLRQPENQQLVSESLRKFNGAEYLLTDFVVMPNHVHLLVAFKDDDSMLSQCESWKRFTARAINTRQGTRGRFWQQDGFDHLVRSPEQFEHYRRYIARNPTKANLAPDEFTHYAAPM